VPITSHAHAFNKGACSLATMTDVAKKAGVSISTVSHVLNKTRTVTPETIRAVENAIAEVGFAPNILARSLVRSSTNAIGVSLSAITNIYFGEVVRGIQAECTRHGFVMFFADTEDKAEHQFEVIRELHQRRVDGIILAPVPDPQERTLNYLKRHQIPVVFVDRSIDEDFDQVVVENRKPMADLVTHLVEHGHKRIGMVAGLEGLSTTVERIDGYREALAKAGLNFDETLLVSGKSDVETAHDAVLRLMAQRYAPTALVSANNKMTIGAMRALRELGQRVPKDITCRL
jgi:LacI family transcriptional regulator